MRFLCYSSSIDSSSPSSPSFSSPPSHLLLLIFSLSLSFLPFSFYPILHLFLLLLLLLLLLFHLILTTTYLDYNCIHYLACFLITSHLSNSDWSISSANFPVPSHLPISDALFISLTGMKLLLRMRKSNKLLSTSLTRRPRYPI